MAHHNPSDSTTNAPSQAGTDPRQRARRLAVEALAAEDEARALRLAGEALQLDPDCSDALLLRAQLGDLADDEFIEALRHALAAAERGLGPDFIRRHGGELGHQESAHPYLRARHQLALALLDSDDDDEVGEAIGHLTDLLDLCDDDALGCRYVLLGWYLIEHDYPMAGELLDRFPDDQSLVMQLARAMVAFKAKRRSQAEALYRSAQQLNRNLRSVLMRPEALARPVEKEYIPGSPDEARHCLQVAVLPLLDDPDLLEWIVSQPATPGRNDFCPCGSGKKYKNCCGRA